MKQNLLKITKFMAVFALLVLSSCEKELYEDTITKSKFKVSYVNSDFLENNSLLMSKISKSSFFEKSSIKRKNLSGRIVYDTINGYYIDTEKVKYIEGDGFNSYTFEVIKPDNTTLDNLVLMSKLNGEYKPYAMRYMLTQDEKSKLDSDEYINFTNKCIATEISESSTLEEVLSKFNAPGIENCIMVYSWQEVVSITPCSIDGCLDYPWATTSVSHVLVGSLQCSQGLGGGGGFNDVGTSPHGGGGGDNLGAPLTPCNKLKRLFTRANIKPIIQNSLQTDISLNPSGEKGLSLAMNSSGTVTSAIIPSTSSNTVGIPAGLNYYSGIHTHPLDTYPMFSWSDIVVLNNLDNLSAPYNADMASFLLVCKDDNGVFQTYAIVFDGLNNPVDAAINDPTNAGKTIDMIKAEMDVKLGIKYDEESATGTPNYERAFLKFMQSSNVSLYKANSSLNNWSKLSLSNNTPTAVVNSTNCN